MKHSNNIRRLRFENSEMTQQQLADRAGVSRITIYSIESGKIVPSTMLALKITRIFNKKFEDVFFLEEERN